MSMEQILGDLHKDIKGYEVKTDRFLARFKINRFESIHLLHTWLSIDRPITAQMPVS